MKKIIIAFSFLLLAVTLNAQRINRDTLVLNDTSIHFITIGAQTFEIKRTVSVEPAPSPFTNMFRIGGGGSNVYLLNNGLTGTIPPLKKDN